MIKCIIVDDEPLAVELLESYVRSVDTLELMGSFNNPVHAINFTIKEKPDLIFLDIRMPEMTGVQVMEVIGSLSKIVVTSAYPDYALVGYEHSVVDYLMKPIDYDRFLKAVQKARDFLLLPAYSTVPRKYFFIKTDGKLVRIDFDDILYIEGLRDYVAVHTVSEKLNSLDTLLNMESQLPAGQFARIHKSYLVSLEKIDTIEGSRVFVGNTILPVGSLYREKFLKLIKPSS